MTTPRKFVYLWVYLLFREVEAMDTMKKCPTCTSMYAGEVCPKCMAAFAEQPSSPTGAEEPPAHCRAGEDESGL